jgi:abortive infection bacteriophage resistance protein
MAVTYTLTKLDEDKISRFIGGKFSPYFFKNFLDIACGNVNDALLLYNFDSRLRIVLFMYILKFELLLRNDLVEKAEKAGASKTFWNDSSYFIKSSTIVSPGKTISKFDELQKNVREDISGKVFSNHPIQNENIFYSISYGRFLRFFELLDSPYKNDFVKSHFNGVYDYEGLKQYLHGIRLIRNRCAHSNHIISPKFKIEYKVMSFSIFSPEFGLVNTEFAKCLLFVYNNLKFDDQNSFRRDILTILDKYQAVSNKYYRVHTIDFNLNDHLRQIWRIKNTKFSKLLYKLKKYVKI